MTDLLTAEQAKVAAEFLDQESQRREHLVVSLCGAHAYGFASVDSDLDLKAVHVSPTRTLLGLSPAPTGAEKLELRGGVELDYSSNEVAAALNGVLRGNGNMIERLLDPNPLVSHPDLAELRPLVAGQLCRRVHNHYRGFAASQRSAYLSNPSLKKGLYVLRTALTGAHALRTGEVVPDLSVLGPMYRFFEVPELIAAKRAAERARTPAEFERRMEVLFDRAFQTLEASRDASPLPEHPPEPDRLEAWLLDLRQRRW